MSEIAALTVTETADEVVTAPALSYAFTVRLYAAAATPDQAYE